MARNPAGWRCGRRSKGVKCGALNPWRVQICRHCGKKRTRPKSKHDAARKMPYEAYIELNGGEFCGICGKGPDGKKRLDRDHDHSTGAPRGLLCRFCNRRLRVWLDLPFLRGAVTYLEQAEARRVDA